MTIPLQLVKQADLPAIVAVMNAAFWGPQGTQFEY